MSAEILISYARADRPVAEDVARLLEAERYSVWWDRELAAGDEFSEVIERTLDSAKAVIVLWSETSRKSLWVRDEAAVGRDRNRLIPIALDSSQPPLGFRQIHTVTIEDVRGNPRIRAALLTSLAILCGRVSAQTPFADAPQGTIVAGAAAPVDKPLRQILQEEKKQRDFVSTYWLMGLPVALAIAALFSLFSQLAETYPLKSLIGNFIFGFVLSSASLGLGRLFIVAGRRLSKRKSVRYFDGPTIISSVCSVVFAAAMVLLATTNKDGPGDSALVGAFILTFVFPIFAMFSIPIGLAKGVSRTSFEDGK